MLYKRLEALGSRLMEMAELTRSMLDDSLKALEILDVDLATRVADVDELLVNQMETWNLEEAIHVITLFQPMGKNVRQLVAVILINRDLERIADHAQNIANHARYLASPEGEPESGAACATLGVIELPRELLNMGEMARKMVADSLRAYNDEDEELAKRVIAGDAELNDLTARTVRILLGRMSGGCSDGESGDGPGLTETCWRLALVARNLERVGDHATNIAESVLFVVESHLHLHHKHEIAKELARMKEKKRRPRGDG
ncbi:MAG TPA: phosphate signaling complex protein PhoU [bacterium]|nr:phosphate signaling complex protein PhoU [bacterium]